MELLDILHVRRDVWAWASIAINWLRATEETGLRPIEWRDARLIRNLENEVWLEVRNAKATKLRGNGETRRLLLATGERIEWPERIVQELIHDLARAREHATFAECYAGVRHCIRRANQIMEHARRRRARPGSKPAKHITLYSLRHRFVADAKAS